MRLLILAAFAFLVAPAGASAQFRDDFEGASVALDASGLGGWAHFTGDGQAEMTLRRGGDGYASIEVDATRDRRNVWWALVKRGVSAHLDLARLARPGQELRVEARLRVSHAPRRVNLHVNTQRTTDFHSHLMEYDIPTAGDWHTISMTTRGFDARPGDAVFAQMALIDWGRGRYGVDLDYLKVEVVDAAAAGADLGDAVPYHPPIPDPAIFRERVRAAHDSTIDLAFPDVALNAWSARDGGGTARLVGVGGTRYGILRFDLSAFAGRTVSGHGLLELTSHSVQRTSDEVKDFGLIRVVEILGGDPAWNQATVTASSLLGGAEPADVICPQMIIDWPAAPERGAKTWFTISRPVLQRLIDGRTKGLALTPLGSMAAAFYALEHDGGTMAARLLFDVE